MRIFDVAYTIPNPSVKELIRLLLDCFLDVSRRIVIVLSSRTTYSLLANINWNVIRRISKIGFDSCEYKCAKKLQNYT